MLTLPLKLVNTKNVPITSDIISYNSYEFKKISTEMYTCKRLVVNPWKRLNHRYFLKTPEKIGSTYRCEIFLTDSLKMQLITFLVSQSVIGDCWNPVLNICALAFSANSTALSLSHKWLLKSWLIFMTLTNVNYEWYFPLFDKIIW